MMERRASLLPFQPLTMREWSKAAYTSHVIRDHVSLGSQFQYLPQAYSAQTASRPNIAPVVPATDYDQYFDLRAKLLERSKGGGVIGVGERIRDHGR